MDDRQLARLRAKTSTPGILAKVEPGGVVPSASMTDSPSPATGGRPATGIKQKERGMLRIDDETWEMLLDKAGSSGKPRAQVIRDAIREHCSR